MKQIQLGASSQMVSVILGCMRINGAKDPVKVIGNSFTIMESIFDHADIYGGGE